MNKRPVLLVEDDKILRLVQVLLDPQVSTDRLNAFADYLSTDIPDFLALLERLRKDWKGLYPCEVKMVKSTDDFETFLPSADHVFVESFELGETEIALSPRLKSVHQFGLRTNHLDLQACKKSNIQVFTHRRLTNIALAEHTLMLCLNLARRFPFVNGLIRSSDLEAAGLPYRPYNLLHTANANYGRIPGLTLLHGKTLGLLGFGEIAKEVATRAQSFGLRVICSRPSALNEQENSQWAVENVAFDQLLRESDFLSVHAPLNAHTQDLLDHKALQLMRKGAYIINTARANIVNHDALYQALVTRHLAGAAFDVHYQEPASEHENLLGLSNFISTPHLAGASRINNLQDVISLIEQCLKVIHHTSRS
jgi:phosphoglycerate dehydrogenase-like enzyme